MYERRNHARLRVLKGAKFVFRKSLSRDCIVRNLTNAGAGIEIPNTTDLPSALELTFDGGRSTRPAQIVWRTLSRVGVKFK